MLYNIGDKIKVKATGEGGTVTDRMYSEARSTAMYIVKPEDGGRSFMRREDELALPPIERVWSIETEVAEGVVIGVIYEVIDGQKFEICRGHGHIIHEGAEGIAQACSYAYKKALERIDTGIYFKDRRQD